MTEKLVNVVAQEKLAEVELLVKGLTEAETKLEHGYAKLACMLKDVAENRYWQGSYESFGEYLDHISSTYNFGKSQLYNFRAAARDLDGQVTEQQLDQMGISKALALRESVNNTGGIPENILTAALDPNVTVKDIRKLLFDAGTIMQPEDGTWMDLDFSCYVTQDERAEINDACNAARIADPPINETQKDFMQRKEILLRFAREFLNTYDSLEGGRGF